MQLSASLALLLSAAGVLAVPAPIPEAANPANGTNYVDQMLPPVVTPNTRANDRALIEKLLLAPSARERLNLLNVPGDSVYDFTNPPPNAIAQGRGGRVVVTNREVFPAVIGNGGSVSIGFLDACGLNSPHVHNRATEFNLVVKGRLVSSFIQENGVAHRQDLLGLYHMTVFPQGAIHAEYNPDCDPAVFVAAFPSEDPGVEQVAQAFFSLRPDIASASLNGVTMLEGADIENFRDYLPDNVVVGVESCLKKCGIPKKAKRDIAIPNPEMVNKA